MEIPVKVEKTEAVTTLSRNIVTNVKPRALRYWYGQLKSAWSGHRIDFSAKQVLPYLEGENVYMVTPSGDLCYILCLFSWGINRILNSKVCINHAIL